MAKRWELEYCPVMRSGLIWNNLYCRAYLLPVTPQKRTQQLVISHGKSIQEVAHLTEVTFAATPQGQHWFFPPGYVTKIDYGENESTAASKSKLVTHLPQNANCIHPSQTCSFRKMSACPSLGRSGKGQLLKQYEQIWDLELLHVKSFTSTEYLWYGHWKVPNLFSASPSTDISVKDIKNNFHSEMTGWEWSSS